MKNENGKDILQKLLSMNLQDRIRAVEEDVNSKMDLYTVIDPFDLAQALEVPVNAIDGSGDGDWNDWAQYGYIYVDSFEDNLDSYEIDEMLEFLDFPEERYEFLQKNILKVKANKFIELLTDDEKSLISLNIALNNLYDMDGDGYDSFAKYYLEHSDMCFKAIFDGDGTIAELKTPYHLRDKPEASSIWIYENSKLIFSSGEDSKTKYNDVKEVWIEAILKPGADKGEITNYLEYLKWIKEHINKEPAIYIFRFFNNE